MASIALFSWEMSRPCKLGHLSYSDFFFFFSISNRDTGNKDDKVGEKKRLRKADCWASIALFIGDTSRPCGLGYVSRQEKGVDGNLVLVESRHRD